jgi:hypothetical protein
MSDQTAAGGDHIAQIEAEILAERLGQLDSALSLQRLVQWGMVVPEEIDPAFAAELDELGVYLENTGYEGAASEIRTLADSARANEPQLPA